ncbi:hypothetical protein [Azohydromonas aeria]|uniref:hypothetical protein n=1 Tax=Azohydromonas aeria TaxID=2590212 RepID=UPI0012FCFF51|nr:hypothetical protein [Azohydromonas aeria]
MDQHRSQPDDTPQENTRTDDVEARRRLLRRSLGLAAPVALTLASAPVAAGVCRSASAFVSVNAHLSRQPQDTATCLGDPPDAWARQISSGSYSSLVTATFQEKLGGLLTSPTRFNIVNIYKVTQNNRVLVSNPSELANATRNFQIQTEYTANPRTDASKVTLLEVLLKQPWTVEAYIAAAWLNATYNPSAVAVHPFNSPAAIKDVWANIRNNVGEYRPTQETILDSRKTLDWLATSWK